MLYNELEKREAFHLEFLRNLLRKVPPAELILKGGSNLRFFFGSKRYSEDMDLDVRKIELHSLRDAVMSVLESRAMAEAMLTYGIERVVPPDVGRAKQTETVQRFKIHLQTAAGEDLFTKVEFSRRGISDPFLSGGVEATVLARYRMPPLIASHYSPEVWDELRLATIDLLE